MRPRCARRPRLEEVEVRIALSGLTIAAPELSHQLQLQHQLQAQMQGRIQARQERAAEAAAQRTAVQEQQQLARQERQLRRQEQQMRSAAARSSHPAKAAADDGDFSFSKIWKTIFPW